MFFEPSPTPFDLRFPLFGVHVRVNPWFWLVSAILGWDMIHSLVQFGIIAPRQELLYVVLWVGCVFVSILLHELGHVVVGRLFGSRGHIVLYSFGGLAIGSSDVRYRWQQIAVSAAGPAVQLALYGLLLLLARQLRHADGHLSIGAALALDWLLWINLYWAILNLLPIWPLDGGKIAREICTWFSRQRGVTISLVLSIVVAVVLAINELAMRNGKGFLPFGMGDLYLAIFFGIFAINNITELQAMRYRGGGYDDQW